jgi:tetratricopeptide (TPR) repeat protein
LQPTDYCFPSRLEELLVLEDAVSADPSDARANYYLGNLLYNARRREEALDYWEQSACCDPNFAIAWRNLGLAYLNARKDTEKAKDCYLKAFELKPADPRLLLELNQLMEVLSVLPIERLARLEAHRDVVDLSDLLFMELVCLYNLTGQPEKALDMLQGRRFHPWEGGENPTLRYVEAHYLLGKRALQHEDWSGALLHFNQSLEYPDNLRSGRLKPTPETHIHYHAGLALEGLGDRENAIARFSKAAAATEELSPQAYYQALALRRLGQEDICHQRLLSLLSKAIEQRDREYIAPFHEPYSADFTLFDEDMQERNQLDSTYLVGLAYLGLGKLSQAEAAFGEVLSKWPHHGGAQEHMQDLRTAQARTSTKMPG